MEHHVDPKSILEEQRHLGEISKKTTLRFGVVGLLLVALAVVLSYTRHHGPARFLSGYLTAYGFVLSLALGGLFFTAIHHLTKAGWSTTVRRVAELMAGNFPLLGILALPILVPTLLGSAAPYKWADTAWAEADHLVSHKVGYLNGVFFAIRIVVYFVIWSWLARFFLVHSVEQDNSGDRRHTASMEKLSAPAIVLFALTTTFAAFDLFMSTDPHWFSTIFGVYYFSGSVMAFFAFMSIAFLWLRKHGLLKNAVTVEHYHDLGKYCFAFVFFWSYIAFSQFLLYWYGDIPEETSWYLKRSEGYWGAISMVLVFGHCLVPFLGLLSRHAKRNLGVLAFWSVFLLIMHWVDLAWVVLPEAGEHAAAGHGAAAAGTEAATYAGFAWLDLCCFIGLFCLFVANTARLAKHCSLVPEQDPRLGEALAFHNI